MKFKWEAQGHARIGLHVELGEYDANPPVTSLLLDYAPLSMNPERLAIAAYLAFGRWASGDFLLPMKLGPATASAIERDLRHVDVRPGPIEYYPKPLEVGVREVGLLVGNEHTPAPSDSTITVLPSSSWHGGMRGLRSITVASNAYALDNAASTTPESVRARLAVGVLFAGDLSADRVSIRWPHSLPDTEKSRISALLLSVRLGVRFVESA